MNKLKLITIACILTTWTRSTAQEVDQWLPLYWEAQVQVNQYKSPSITGVSDLVSFDMYPTRSLTFDFGTRFQLTMPGTSKRTWLTTDFGFGNYNSTYDAFVPKLLTGFERDFNWTTTLNAFTMAGSLGLLQDFDMKSNWGFHIGAGLRIQDIFVGRNQFNHSESVVVNGELTSISVVGEDFTEFFDDRGRINQDIGFGQYIRMGIWVKGTKDRIYRFSVIAANSPHKSISAYPIRFGAEGTYEAYHRFIGISLGQNMRLN